MPTKQGAVSLGMSAVLASAVLAGCSKSHDDPKVNSIGVCVDQKTHKRLPDSDCEHRHHSAWVYYGMGRNIPGVGGYANGYTTREPKGYYTKGGFSAKGGAASRYTSLMPQSAPIHGGSDVRAAGNADAHGNVKGGSVGSVARGGFGHGGGEGGHGG